jgi:6,7-dimethyl-8-ribityllumazine synthase
MEAMNMKTLEGQLTAQGMKVAIVVARFNEFITSKLLSGAIASSTVLNLNSSIFIASLFT